VPRDLAEPDPSRCIPNDRIRDGGTAASKAGDLIRMSCVERRERRKDPFGQRVPRIDWGSGSLRHGRLAASHFALSPIRVDDDPQIPDNKDSGTSFRLRPPIYQAPGLGLSFFEDRSQRTERTIASLPPLTKTRGRVTIPTSTLPFTSHPNVPLVEVTERAKTAKMVPVGLNKNSFHQGEVWHFQTSSFVWRPFIA